jgi:hypothetical protein
MEYLQAIKDKNQEKIEEIEANPELAEMVAGIKGFIIDQLTIIKMTNLILREQCRILGNATKIPLDERTLANFRYRYLMLKAQRYKELTLLLGEFEKEYNGELSHTV